MKQKERSSAARRCILEQAEHLIHLRGYHCTSLDDIAGRCRMTKANLLHHFRSKEELGLAVLDYKIEAYRRSRLDPIFPPDADAARAVKELFSRAARFHRSNGCKAGCFIANMALEMSDSNSRFREKAAAFFGEWISRLEEIFRRRRAAGRLPASFDPRRCAEAIVSLYEGAVMLARARRDPGVFDRAGKTAAELVEGRERAAAPPWNRPGLFGTSSPRMEGSPARTATRRSPWTFIVSRRGKGLRWRSPGKQPAQRFALN